MVHRCTNLYRFCTRRPCWLIPTRQLKSLLVAVLPFWESVNGLTFWHGRYCPCSFAATRWPDGCRKLRHRRFQKMYKVSCSSACRCRLSGKSICNVRGRPLLWPLTRLMHLVLAYVLQLPIPITFADWDDFALTIKPWHKKQIPNSCLFVAVSALIRDNWKRLQVCLVSSGFCARLITIRGDSCSCLMPEQLWVHSPKDAPQLQVFSVLSKKRQLFSWLETWWCDGFTLHLNQI